MGIFATDNKKSHYLFFYLAKWVFFSGLPVFYLPFRSERSRGLSEDVRGLATSEHEDRRTRNVSAQRASEQQKMPELNVRQRIGNFKRTKTVSARGNAKYEKSQSHVGERENISSGRNGVTRGGISDSFPGAPEPSLATLEQPAG